MPWLTASARWSYFLPQEGRSVTGQDWCSRSNRNLKASAGGIERKRSRDGANTSGGQPKALETFTPLAGTFARKVNIPEKETLCQRTNVRPDSRQDVGDQQAVPSVFLREKEPKLDQYVTREHKGVAHQSKIFDGLAARANYW